MRQVYGYNPATGRVEHHYRDMGATSARPLSTRLTGQNAVGDGHKRPSGGGGRDA